MDQRTKKSKGAGYLQTIDEVYKILEDYNPVKTKKH